MQENIAGLRVGKRFNHLPTLSCNFPDWSSCLRFAIFAQTFKVNLLIFIRQWADAARIPREISKLKAEAVKAVWVVCTQKATPRVGRKRRSLVSFI